MRNEVFLRKMHKDVKNAKFQTFWETVVLWDLGYKKNRIQRKSALKTVFSTSVEFGKQRSSRVIVSVLCLSDALFKNKLIRSYLSCFWWIRRIRIGFKDLKCYETSLSLKDFSGVFNLLNKF